MSAVGRRVAFLEKFIELRPYAYHVSQQTNLASLARTLTIESSASLIRRAGRFELLRQRREIPTPIQIDGETVVLQDQLPLVFNNAQFPVEWTSSPWLKGDRHDRSDVLHSRHGYGSSQRPRTDAGIVDCHE
jgi:hypothetical protein